MKETAKEAARQRKIYMILIIILIIVLTVLGGGYYFMMQTKAASQKTSGKNSDDQSQTSQTSGSDTLEYKGGIYKYNDHLRKMPVRQMRFLWFPWTGQQKKLRCSLFQEIL